MFHINYQAETAAIWLWYEKYRKPRQNTRESLKK